VATRGSGAWRTNCWTHPWRRTTARSGPPPRAQRPYRCRLVNSLLDHIELLAVLVAGSRRTGPQGRVIGDTIAEVLDQIRSTTQSTGLDRCRPPSSSAPSSRPWQRLHRPSTGSSSRPSSSPSRSTSLARRPSPRRRPEGRRGEENPPRAERSAPGHQGQGRPARPRVRRRGGQGLRARPRQAQRPDDRRHGLTPTHPFQSSERIEDGNPSLAPGRCMQRQHDLPPPGGGATVVDLLTDFGVELIWHPSLGPELGEAVQAILADLVSERKPLDIFVLEGTVITGPAGSGRMDMFAGRPMTEWITGAHQRGLDRGRGRRLRNLRWAAHRAANPSASTGLQFHRGEIGGYSARTGCPSSGCRSSTSLAAPPTPTGSARW